MTEKEFHKQLLDAANIKLFKEFWDKNLSYILRDPLTDEEILLFIKHNSSIELACDRASDYLMSQGLADVQE